MGGKAYRPDGAYNDGAVLSPAMSWRRLIVDWVRALFDRLDAERAAETELQHKAKQW